MSFKSSLLLTDDRLTGHGVSRLKTRATRLVLLEITLASVLPFEYMLQYV